ncbi:MAG: hypothetical protein ACRBI6_11300 [Acidimicrobiales bacterium]
MTDSTDLTDLEHEFANTVARLRDHLPAIAEAGPPADGGQASAADGVVFLDSIGPSTEPASTPGRRRDARRLLAVAAAVVVVFGVAVWWGDRSTDSGPSIADDTDGDSTFEVLPGEIVVSEDPLIVVLADPSPDVDAIGLQIDQPITPVAVDGSLINAPGIGSTESGWIEAEGAVAPEVWWAMDSPNDVEVVEASSKTTIAGLAHGALMFRVDSELLLADGSRFYSFVFRAHSGSGQGSFEPIGDRPWFGAGGTNQATAGTDERLVVSFGDLGNAVAIRLTTPDTVVTAGVAGGMAEIETTIVEQHTRVRLERLLPDGTWDGVLLDAGAIGLTGNGPGNPASEITLESLDPEPPPSTVTVYGAEWCAPCNDLDGFAADVEAAREAVEGSLVKVRLVAATREEWPDPERDWPFATGLRSAGVGQFSPTLPWVVITDADGRFIYSGAIPTRAELIEAFEVLAAE